MAEITDRRLAVAVARLSRERALQAMHSAESHANFWREEDGTLPFSDPTGLSEVAVAEVAGLQPALDAAAVALAEAQATFDHAVGEYDAIAAQAPLFDADNGLPLLLLPVRIEAVYRTGDSGSELCIRVYPDDIHVDTHEPALTAAERQAGERHWRDVWAAGPDRARRAAAWEDLVTAVGGTRAGWVREALKPQGEPPAEATPPGAAGPDPRPFPEVPTRQEAWTRAARTTLLPDHFEFSAYRDGVLAWRHEGASIPDTLSVGFAPADEDAERPDGLPWDDESRWLVDFEQAVRIGMGLVVPLAAADESFDLLTVVGVGTQDAATGAEWVQATLAAHAYVNGLSSLQPGTPTNNTPASRAGWRSRDRPADPDEVDARRSAYDPAGDQDAPRLARALGVDGADVLAASCDPADGAETTLATLHRLQAAYYRFSQIWRPVRMLHVIDDLSQGPEFLADHFAQFVRGRGPLPLLRVGRQPYGVLPVTALNLWHGDDVDTRIVEYVTSFATAMSEYVPRAIKVGEGADQDAVLLDLLSREAAPRRLVEDLSIETNFLVDRPPAAVVGSIPATSLLALLPVPQGGAKTYLPFPDDVSDDIAAVLRSKPLTGMLAIADEFAAVIAADPAQADLTAFEDRWSLLHGSILPLVGTVRSTFYRQAQSVSSLMFIFLQGLALRDEIEGTPEDIEHMKVGAAMWRTLFAEYVSLEDVATSDLAGWERLMREVLDTLSHRVDAWVTSLPTARLAGIRRSSASGVRTGAYGWLTDVGPGDPAPQREGFVLTPSLHHATTAAVLRSGWQAHSDRRAFAVDVQSTRVRRALALAEGVRGGQSVAALLGYQFERALHDAQLDRFVAGFRKTYPLAPLVEPEGIGSQEARVAIGARNVVDGQAIRQDRALLLEDDVALAQAAVPAIEVEVLLREEAAAVRRMISDLDETFDAAADLLLAESVHHLVGGSPLRAGLAADAAGRGQDLPMEFDVTRTPRSGTAVSHHVGVLLPERGAAGWSAERPLADLEPALEAWAQRRLGPAGDWIFERATQDGAPAGPVSLANLGWCALDVLVASDTRLLDALLADGPGSVGLSETGGIRFGELGQMCGRLRAVVASATPLTPTHLDPADPTPGTGYDVTDLAARVRPWVDEVLDARAELAQALAQAQESADEAAARRVLSRLTDLGVTAAAVGDVASSAERVLDVLAQSGLDTPEPPPDAEAEPAAAEGWVNRLLASASQVLAPAIKVVPRLRRPLPAPPALGAVTDDVLTWLRDMALVRGQVEALDTALVAAAVLTEAEVPVYVVAQPPTPSTGAPAAWLATAAPTGTDRPGCSVVLQQEPDAAADPVAGLVVDSWAEVVPRAAGPESPEEIAGVTFDHDRPGARAPQTILLAVPPDPARGWCLEDVHGCVEETLLLARMRALDLVDVPELRTVLPIPNIDFPDVAD